MEDFEPSQETVARQFMELRGYDETPIEIETFEDEAYAWRFHYLLPEGRLELDVTWSADDGWVATVFDFERSE